MKHLEMNIRGKSSTLQKCLIIDKVCYREPNYDCLQIATLNASWSVKYIYVLKHLQLSYNNIKVLRSDVFNGLSKVKDLGLRNNGISEIESGVFSSITDFTLYIDNQLLQS